MTRTFAVENIKCGGCMHTIRKRLEQLPGVITARPDHEEGIVDVDFDEHLVSAGRITTELTAMGYPPAGSNNLGRKVKSYVSCMIGRVGADPEPRHEEH